MERDLLLGLYDRSTKSYDYKYESFWGDFLYFILGALSQYGVYWGIMYCYNIYDIVGTSYSFMGKMFSSFLILVAVGAVIFGLYIFPFFWWSVFKHIYLFLVALPKYILNEFYVIKRIWENRGFGKYSLFGGFMFYFKLRQRIVAYLFAFISIGIVAWYFTFKQHTFEKDHWKIKFYRNEPLPTFLFKPNIPYTVETSTYTRSILFNFIEYEKIDGFTETWNITLKDSTYVFFNLESHAINEIFSQSLEIWENRKEGMTVFFPQDFSCKERFTNPIEKTKEVSKTKPNKKKKI